MAELKTKANKASVNKFIQGVANAQRKADAKTVLKLTQDGTGEKPTMWGPSIIGFGTHHYEYESGRSGEMCRIGFSPRAASLVFYLGDFAGRDKLLEKLGECRVTPGCLYIKRLELIDEKVLATMVKKAWSHRDST